MAVSALSILGANRSRDFELSPQPEKIGQVPKLIYDPRVNTIQNPSKLRD